MLDMSRNTSSGHGSDADDELERAGSAKPAEDAASESAEAAAETATSDADLVEPETHAKTDDTKTSKSADRDESPDDDSDDEDAAPKPKTARELAREKREAERRRIERSKEIARRARGRAGAGPSRDRDRESTLHANRASQATLAEDSGEANPPWFKPIMFGFLLLGLLWLLVFYFTGARFPIAELGNWNILVGFGIALIGFLMMPNWR